MRINIPVKLEKYKEHIKKSSFKIVYRKNFSFLKIGSVFKDDSYKELYLCYNPYNTNITFDINSFKNDIQIYKLYPQIINVPNHEVYAFMVFSTSETDLEFNMDSLIYNKKSNIKNMLNKISEKNHIFDSQLIVEEFTDEVNSTMMLDDNNSILRKGVEKVNIDKTQNIGNAVDVEKLKEETILYSKIEKNKHDIKVKLKNVSYNKKRYHFVITLINNSISENYEIQKIYVNLFDKANKETVEINQKITLRKYSQKDFEFFIREESLQHFNLKDVKVDVELV